MGIGGQLEKGLNIDGGTDNTPIGNVGDQLKVIDFSNSSGIQGAISVTTSATALRVGGSNLTNRKTLTAYNNGSSTIYWGYDNTVTTSSGTPLEKNQFASWEVGDNVTLYAITSSGSQNVRITESA